MEKDAYDVCDDCGWPIVPEDDENALSFFKKLQIEACHCDSPKPRGYE